ncbi:MAG TPA: cytidine deaminase [Thermoanaerobaculia bacterium]|nr:cytidine deaminase [Thermoanaerobaculia bacterium]
MEPPDRARLIEEAKKAREMAVAPFSGFRVGAALLTGDGTIVHGCNIENCTYGLTVCAERVAVFSALATGHRNFASIAVVTQSEHPSSPCGPCRQILWEFCGDIPVVLANLEGETRRTSVGELFPLPFDFKPEDR